MSIKTLIEKSKSFVISEDEIDNKENGRKSFIEKFPLKKIKNLTIDEFVQGTDENSFCYWLEFKKILFGIGGGNASKFGLYKTNPEGIPIYVMGTGAKKIKLEGQKLELFYKELINAIVKALVYAENDQIEKIKELNIPMWNMVLQKILSIYYPDKFITIGSSDVLIECARDIKLEGIDLKSRKLNSNKLRVQKILRFIT